MTDMMQGLTISVLGMSVTFTALGLFIGIMVVLKRLFPYTEETEAVVEAEETPIPMEVVASQPDSSAAEVAAAIAVAVSHFRAQSSSQLGASLHPQRGAWWNANRVRANEGQIQKR